ncbi:putative bifunctional diguanylate cyclase/phosphodiesterase [Hydrogenimonas sp.]
MVSLPLKKKDLFFSLLLVILLGSFIYIYTYLHHTEKEIFKRIERDKIAEYTYILANISNHLTDFHGLDNRKKIREYFKNPNNRRRCIRVLQTLVTKNTKFIYILQKDEKGRFRFLLDASKEDIAPFWMKFDVSGKAYDRLYETKKPQVIHESGKGIYLTLLYPIVGKKEKDVLALLSMDINIGIKNEISKLLAPMKGYFTIFIVLMLLIALISIVHILYYLSSKKRIYFDPLTKVFNRNYLNDIVANKDLSDYALAIIDIDRFKQINDTYGHEAGDKVLTELVERIASNIRKNDFLIRYGGDEFLLFVYTRGEDDIVVQTCERIRENVQSAAFTYRQFELNITLSIGIEPHPTEYKNIQRAIKEADTLLFESKNGGRNIVSVKKEKKRSAIKDLTFVKDAINNGRVICHYQPIYTPDGEIVSYEALVRIVSETGDIVPPLMFLPQIKHTNVYAKLTKRVLQIVFDTFEKNNSRISVNVSYQDIMNQEIFNYLFNYLENSENFAHRFTLEILESEEIADRKAFRQKIDLLKQLGCRISIDDFGSGYANFKHIIDLNADYLKIDGSLIKVVDTNKKSRQVVENIISFAHNADLLVVGEFVHSKKVLEILEGLGIDYVQGYYFSPPRPPEELPI